MKAVIIREHGDLDKLNFTEVPDPKPGPGEVLVKVKACALNHLDIWTRLGMKGITIPMPHILGCDVAGEIVSFGKKVGARRASPVLKAGQKVVVSPGILPLEDPLIDTEWESLSDQFRIFGFQVDGGYAEYIKVPVRNALPVAGKLSFEEWAAVPLVFLTAWHMLVTRANLQEGETVLIHAAGSGVGSAAIQLAKYLGAEVITTVGSDEKKKRALEIGADHVINYRTSDFVEEVRNVTKGKGVDVVLEHIGPETFNKSLASLKKKGRLVTCGVTSGPAVQIDLRFLFVRQYSLMGCYMGGMKELKKVIGLVQLGKLKPTVDRIYPLKDARAAQERMLSRQNFGKIVLVP